MLTTGSSGTDRAGRAFRRRSNSPLSRIRPASRSNETVNVRCSWAKRGERQAQGKTCNKRATKPASGGDTTDVGDTSGLLILRNLLEKLGNPWYAGYRTPKRSALSVFLKNLAQNGACEPFALEHSCVAGFHSAFLAQRFPFSPALCPFLLTRLPCCARSRLAAAIAAAQNPKSAAAA